jgi:hypothetical protein
MVTDISTIMHALPADPGILRALSARSSDAGRRAARAGSHMEVRRMSFLAMQLTPLADKALKSM